MRVRGASDDANDNANNGTTDKKLLITCLQFLNNLIARNEQRKLMLWIELFDSHLDNELPNFADMKYKMDEFPQQDDEQALREQAARNLDTFKIPQQPASSPFLLYIGETGNEVKKTLMQHGIKAGANEIAAECRRRWQTMNEEEKNVCLVILILQNIVADCCRNGTCSTPTSLPDTEIKSHNPARTRKWWTSTPKTRKVYRRSQKASTNFK